MKHVRLFLLVLTLCVLCFASCSLGNGEHEHTAGKFISSDGRHRKECLTCGEVLFSTPCSYQKTSLGPQGHATACEVCGHVKKAEEAHEIRQHVNVTNVAAKTGEVTFACQECDYAYTFSAGYLEDFIDPSSLQTLDIRPLTDGLSPRNMVENGVLTTKVTCDSRHFSSMHNLLLLRVFPNGVLTNEHEAIVGFTVRVSQTSLMNTSFRWWVNNGVNKMGFATNKTVLTSSGKFLMIEDKTVGEIDDNRFTSVVIYAKLTENPGNAIIDVRFYVDGVHVGSGSAIVFNKNEDKQIGDVSFNDAETCMQLILSHVHGTINCIEIDSIFVADVPADFGDVQK